MDADERERFGVRMGLDENGLGPRLGPLIVTAAHAEVSPAGERRWRRRLPDKIRADLDDSKVLVSSEDASLGEAWARVVVERCTGRAPRSPQALLRDLCLESESSLKRHCPSSTVDQCWDPKQQKFQATAEQLSRVATHLDALAARGVSIKGARVEIVCAGRLNRLGEEGVHRFMADLHCMERLILACRDTVDAPLLATCGKVGGIGKYLPFFGPLSGRLVTVLEEGRERSRYLFPQIGEIRFVRDADGEDLLVMLASLIGKYVRELLMDRISGFYRRALDAPDLRPSGYHDPVTARFVERTEQVRRKLDIVHDCFERRKAEERKKSGRKPRSRERRDPSPDNAELFSS